MGATSDVEALEVVGEAVRYGGENSGKLSVVGNCRASQQLFERQCLINNLCFAILAFVVYLSHIPMVGRTRQRVGTMARSSSRLRQNLPVKLESLASIQIFLGIMLFTAPYLDLRS